MLTIRRVLAVAAIALAPPALARAQSDRPAPFELTFGGSGIVGLPLGDFADVVGTPWGLGGHLAFARPGRAFGLRLDATALIYGSETSYVPVGDPDFRQNLEVTTENWMGTMTLGPQLVLPRGRVRPYLTLGAGVSYFATDSEVRASDDFFPISRSTNYDDTVFAWSVGAGFFVPLGSEKPGSLALSVGVRFVGGGEVTYLAEGDVVDRPSGGVAFRTRKSEANRLEFHVGIAGLP
jgi:hypothetical protein